MRKKNGKREKSRGISSNLGALVQKKITANVSTRVRSLFGLGQRGERKFIQDTQRGFQRKKGRSRFLVDGHGE